jgi:3-oxoacyl-[acyl-carrier protein] reductase
MSGLGVEKPLSGQVAVVTGGSRGIGRAISGELARLGARLVINYARNAEAAEQVKAEIEASGGSASVYGFDVGDEEQVESSFKEIAAKEGRLDILVNNAGIAIDALFVRMKDEDWQRTLRTNLTGCFYCARAVSRHMMKARYGRIINISSVIGQTGNAGQAAYATSKAGLFGFTKSLAKELGSRGVTVNVVAPGYIETDMTGNMSEDQIKGLIAQIPLGRVGKPEDIAGVVAFLALPAAGYLSGQIIPVNGGMYM